MMKMDIRGHYLRSRKIPKANFCFLVDNFFPISFEYAIYLVLHRYTKAWKGTYISLNAGDLGNINTPILCSSFTCICPPGRSIDSFVIYDASQPYSEEAISSPSQIAGFSTKIQPLKQGHECQICVWRKLQMNFDQSNSWTQFLFLWFLLSGPRNFAGL